MALREEGIAVTIATGRLYTGTDWVARALGVRGTVAVMNGSELVDVDSDRATHGAYFEASARQTAREILVRHRLPTFLFASRRIHYGRFHDRYAPYLSVWTEELSDHPDVFEAEAWEESQDLLAIGLLGPSLRIEAAREELASSIPGLDVFVFPSPDGETFLKARYGSDDKGTALRRLAADRGLGVEEVVAVGDWLNDVPMLQIAGRSFAMGHARPEVRQAAHEVLEASRDGGAVAEIAEKVWGIRP